MAKKKITDLKFDDKNFNIGSQQGNALLEKSIQKFGFREAATVDKNGVLIGGNKRTAKAGELGFEDVEIIKADPKKVYALQYDDIDIDTPEGRSLALALNATAKSNIVLDAELVEAELGEAVCEEWGIMGNSINTDLAQTKKLSDRFIIPPFSILDTQQGDWQKRKNYWKSIGIKSEIGREENLIGAPDLPQYADNGTKGVAPQSSIFDPVLCELSYQWFNVPKGKILDPFGGGSVRGIVASKLGFEYLGNDLRQEQIEANRINAKEVLGESENYPVWTSGDSLNIDKIAKGYEADMIFSCPPYADLEVYSDLKEDISNMPYKEFISIYREIIRKSCEILKQNRFAVFVVGDVRDKKGFYQNFVSDTIKSFVDCGVLLYNEMILAESIGTAALRASRTFNGGRKVIKRHQNVLVFYKGDPKNIKKNFPELDLSYLQNTGDEGEN